MRRRVPPGKARPVSKGRVSAERHPSRKGTGPADAPTERPVRENHLPERRNLTVKQAKNVSRVKTPDEETGAVKELGAFGVSGRPGPAGPQGPSGKAGPTTDNRGPDAAPTHVVPAPSDEPIEAQVEGEEYDVDGNPQGPVDPE